MELQNLNVTRAVEQKNPLSSISGKFEQEKLKNNLRMKIKFLFENGVLVLLIIHFVS